MDTFFQDGPRLENQYRDDAVLRRTLRRRLPPDVLAAIEPGLDALGARVAGEMLALADAAEAAPPRHVPYDPWGRRVDEIVVSDAWRALDRIAAEEGIVATAYERRHGAFSRVHQLALLYLYHPSSAIYSCPLAMTDGAARAIERHGDAALRERALPRLTARDPALFWTSGQWMTERTGGSDVGGTTTEARPDARGGFTLHGTKWFTSATTSQVALTLARLPGAPEGSRGLSTFYLELRDADGRLDHIVVNRLKDKLGTRALPTAELLLDGVPARLVGEPGAGVRTIATLLNITRVYNAVCAVGYMRRGLALARDYARRRRAFGATLDRHPAHRATLAGMAATFEGCFRLVWHVGELLGREETGTATADESAELRLLTPLAKLFTAKAAVACASETLECFGGAGYVEDTGLPRLLRDAQVLAIWEGTTDVLALDALRAIDREGALGPAVGAARERAGRVADPRLAAARARLLAALADLAAWPGRAAADLGALQAGARGFAFALTRAVAGSLLLADADGGTPRDVAAAAAWCAHGLTPRAPTDPSLAFDDD